MHRDMPVGLAEKATIIINRTSNQIIKTPWLERETREALDQIATELGRVKVMIIPFSEQDFNDSKEHELLNCPHPGCLSKGNDKETLTNLIKENNELREKIKELKLPIQVANPYEPGSQEKRD